MEPLFKNWTKLLYSRLTTLKTNVLEELLPFKGRKSHAWVSFQAGRNVRLFHTR